MQLSAETPHRIGRGAPRLYSAGQGVPAGEENGVRPDSRRWAGVRRTPINRPGAEPRPAPSPSKGEGAQGQAPWRLAARQVGRPASAKNLAKVANLRFGNLRKVSRRTPATRVDAYRALCHGLGVGQQGWAQGPMLQMGAESRLRRAAGAEAQDPIQVKCHEFTGQRHADVAYLPPRVDRPATGLR